LLLGAGMLVSYSRDQEREADQGGFELATAAGYDPTQASLIWKAMSVEDKADPNRPGHGLFGSDHPTDEERLATLAKKGDELKGNRTDWIVNAEGYRAQMAPFRDAWLADEIARGNAYESVVLFERMTQSEPQSGTLAYFLAQAYRKRAKDGDVKRAADWYEKASASADTPVTVWRDMGLLAMKSGDKENARRDFQTYLDHASKADDRAMVEFYITQLGGT
jgi:predicted Zn-dependent protease